MSDIVDIEKTLNRIELNMRGEERNNKKDNSRKGTEVKNMEMVVLSYVGGVSEKLVRIFKNRKISSAMMPNTKHFHTVQ